MAKRRTKKDAMARGPRPGAGLQHEDGGAPPPRRGASLEDEIRLRAYQRYLHRNGEPGDAVADWLEAEADVLARHATGIDARGRVSDEEAGLG